MKKIKIKYNKDEIKIITLALNEFRNKLIQQGSYTEPVDELLLKIIK